jgi:hypothetical protein
MLRDDKSDLPEIPKQYLCRRCISRSSHLREDGRVDCKAAGKAVKPVLRSDYVRFEECPYRSLRLPSHKLKLLAVLARRNRLRKITSESADAQTELAAAKIESAEALIRLDIQVAARRQKNAQKN